MPKNVLPPEVETLGDAIRFLREQKGLTLRALAKEVGVSPPFLSDVEHNRRGTDKIAEFAKALGVDQSLLKKRDGRVTPELKDWLTENPDVVALLNEVRESGQSSAELRTALKRRR